MKPCKIARPSAKLLTTTTNLAQAQEKDKRKQHATTTTKKKALAQIGNELGVSVVVDGVDVVLLQKRRVNENTIVPIARKRLQDLAKKKMPRFEGWEENNGT